MRLAFTSSTDRRLFIPFPSSLPNGWRLKHTVPETIGSFTFQESAPMPPHNHATSESAAKANWRSGRVRRGTFHPSGSDVRTGRRVSHYHPQAPPPASSLSDVRPRPDQISAGLCGGCCRGDWPDHAASGDAFNDLRVRRPARLLGRGVSWSRCAPSWTCAPTESNP